MTTLTATYPQQEFLVLSAHEEVCPYHDLIRNRCSVSFSGLATSGLRSQTYCDNENFDNCPLFLAASLRRW
jgi:hypothetical protein